MQWNEFFRKSKNFHQIFDRLTDSDLKINLSLGEALEQIQFLTEAYRLGARFQRHLNECESTSGGYQQNEFRCCRFVLISMLIFLTSGEAFDIICDAGLDFFCELLACPNAKGREFILDFFSSESSSLLGRLLRESTNSIKTEHLSKIIVHLLEAGNSAKLSKEIKSLALQKFCYAYFMRKSSLIEPQVMRKCIQLLTHEYSWKELASISDELEKSSDSSEMLSGTLLTSDGLFWTLIQIANDSGKDFHFKPALMSELLDQTLEKCFFRETVDKDDISFNQTILEFWANKNVDLSKCKYLILQVTKDVFFDTFSPKYKHTFGFGSRVLKIWIRLCDEKFAAYDDCYFEKMILKMNILPFLLLCTEEQQSKDPERKKYSKELLIKLGSLESSIQVQLEKLSLQANIKNPIKGRAAAK